MGGSLHSAPLKSVGAHGLGPRWEVHGAEIQDKGQSRECGRVKGPLPKYPAGQSSTATFFGGS